MIATFKDLCMDATDAPALGRFWAGALGALGVPRTVAAAGPSDVRVDGAATADTVWVNTVPEPRGAKGRVHWDLRLPGQDAAPLVDAGAVLVSEPSEATPWFVLADPEGTLFCAMRPREGAEPGPFEINIDSADPLAQATWWQGVWGGTVGSHDTEPWAWVEGAAGSPYRYWVFGLVPESKTVKNRWHWDVTLAGDSVQPLLDHGATLLAAPADGRTWFVLADPEGNEFCAFPAT